MHIPTVCSSVRCLIMKINLIENSRLVFSFCIFGKTVFIGNNSEIWSWLELQSPWQRTKFLMCYSLLHVHYFTNVIACKIVNSQRAREKLQTWALFIALLTMIWYHEGYDRQINPSAIIWKLSKTKVSLVCDQRLRWGHALHGRWREIKCRSNSPIKDKKKIVEISKDLISFILEHFTDFCLLSRLKSVALYNVYFYLV